MGKIIALLALFRAGNSVANPQLWIGGAITVSVLLPVIAAAARVARAYGYDVDISDADAAEIAGGIVALVNCVVHVITHEHVGLPAPANGPRVDESSTSAPAPRSDPSPDGAGDSSSQLHDLGAHAAGPTPVDPFGGDHGA